MAKTTKPGFYAVKVGRVPGIYKTWDECRDQVNGFAGSKHQKFPTLAEAEAFVDGAAPPASSSKPKTTAEARTSSYFKTPKAARPTTGSTEDDEPSAKRKKSNGPSDPVFGSRESKFPARRTVYSDGSSKGNGKRGAVAGSGVFWSHESGANNLSERLPGPQQTNNRAEMYAVARILETDPHPEEPLLICTDSKYTIEVFTSYIPGWRARGWKTSSGTTPLNSDLIRYILSLLALRTLHTAPSASSSSRPAPSPRSTSESSCMANVKFKWIKGHAGQEGNEMADKLANEGAALPKAVARDFERLAIANEERLQRSKGAQIKTIDQVTWDVETADLLTDEELKEMERTQEF